MDLAPLHKGKREAEDAIETEVVSAKKQKVEENVGEIKINTIELAKEVDYCCSKPDQCIEALASGVDVHVVSMLEDKSNVLEEDTGAAEKKPVVASQEGHIAAPFEIDEPNNDADSCFQDATSLVEEVNAAMEAPASLSKKDPAAPPKKRDESGKGSDVSSEDAVAFLNEDVAAAKLYPPPPSTKKPSVSIQKKDDSRIHEFDSAHETNNDDNVDTAKEAPPQWSAPAPPGPTEKDPVVNETNEELDLDDDPQTLVTPTEQTSGNKTLYVGNLSFDVWREDIEHFFKAAGEVVNIRFAMNSDDTFKGYGFVEFASAEATEKALCELNGKELLRRRVRLHLAKERGSFTRYTSRRETESFQKGGKSQGQTVFVRGFRKSDHPDEVRKSLEEHFSSCGEVSRVSVPKEQDGCARGIAYIDFKDRDAFDRALALNGSSFREGILSVIEAKPKGDSHNSVGSGRYCGRNSGPDFGGRSGYSNFGGRSGWREFSGRSDVCESGAWSGRGDWGKSSGRDSWCDSSGRGDWGASSRRGDWGNSSGRGVWRGSSGRGDWWNSSGGGAWRNSRGRGALCDSSERGVLRDSSRGGVWRDISERSIFRRFSGNNNVGGTGVWFGGGGRGRGTLTPEAGNNNTTFNNEGEVEDQIN